MHAVARPGAHQVERINSCRDTTVDKKICEQFHTFRDLRHYLR